MDVLPTIWFVAIGALWIGYLVLEGFDLGVGMHMLFTGRSDAQRRVMLNTIGPVWDGTRSGCSPRAPQPSPPSRSGTPRCSPPCTCLSCSCCSA